MPRRTSTLPFLFLVVVAESAAFFDISVQRTSQRAFAPPAPVLRPRGIDAPHSEPANGAAPCPTPRHAPGKVAVVEAIVDERGRVESACVVLSVSPAFDQRALAFVRDHQYEPAIHNGKPVKIFLSASVFEHPR